jgi:disulfide bond formation protein DsbB
MSRFDKARLLAFLLPASLLGGAYVSQYWGGLFPCEMCWWQRYPHFAALAFALLALLVIKRGVLVALAALCLIVSGAIGGFHAGVEYGWWEGLTSCTSTIRGTGEDLLKSIMNAPIVRCDVAPWNLFGISLAGYNFLISVTGGLGILWLLKPKAAS